MTYELQPLRLQAGWTVEWNHFTEYDIAFHGPEGAFELHEDLLQLTHKRSGLTIDLGWYPSYEPEGNYLLLLVKDLDWGRPLKTVETRSKADVIAYIETWVDNGFWGKYVPNQI